MSLAQNAALPCHLLSAHSLETAGIALCVELLTNRLTTNLAWDLCRLEAAALGSATNC